MWNILWLSSKLFMLINRKNQKYKYNIFTNRNINLYINLYTSKNIPTKKQFFQRKPRNIVKNYIFLNKKNSQQGINHKTI